MCLRNQWVTFPIQWTKLNKLNSDINNIFILLYVELFIFHYLNHLIDFWSKESDSSYNRRSNHNNPLQYSCLSQGQRSLVGCHLWRRTESDTTEAAERQQQQQSQKNVMLWQKEQAVDTRWGRYKGGGQLWIITFIRGKFQRSVIKLK